MNTNSPSPSQNLLDQWQTQVLEDYNGNLRISFENGNGITHAYSEEVLQDREERVHLMKRSFGIIPQTKAIVVGLDIREYSRRTAEEQLFLTLRLHLSINKAKHLLARAGILNSDEPRILIQTGDGAYVVFTFLDAFDCLNENQQTILANAGSFPCTKPTAGLLRQLKHKKQAEEKKLLCTNAFQAFSFVLALNTIVGMDNERNCFHLANPQPPAPSESMPVECRYAISYDDVLLLNDFNESLNCVGQGMVTCARILSSDHGNHFLVQEELLRALAPHGGLNNLGSELWHQSLHSSLMPEVQVKSGRFRYADIFGFYHDTPLLQALGRPNLPMRRYHIGSHNVSSLDID